MTGDRWTRIDAILQAALARPPEARERFVTDACGGDAALRDEVLSLLAHAASADGFLEPAAADRRAPLKPGQKLGPYTLGDLIGAGGMGEVYRARDPRLGRDVALKVLAPAMAGDPERLRRFEQEARAAAALNHPNIVTVHSVEQAGGLHFLTMELVEGDSLADRIPRDGLTLDRLLEIVVPLADAVGAAHARGVVHRDLKPGNVMVTSEGRVKVLDFGLAKLKPPAGASDLTTGAAPTLTGEGRLLGTVAYMSPEQAEGREVDHRSDIFSLGVLLYELATGQRPFKGDSSLSLLSSILKDTPAPLTDLKPAFPPELARIVRRSLAKDPSRRYQSAIDLRNELDELKQELGSGGFAQSPTMEPGRQRRRRSIVLIGGGVAALAAVFVYLYFALQPAAPGARPSTFTRVTFEEGLQTQPTWSPDGRFIAYASNQSGDFDIWVLAVGVGSAHRVTADPSNDWQPDWSPDGTSIAFRSERDGGGIFTVPAPLGGPARRVASIGYFPKWSPDGSKLLVVLRPSQDVVLIIPHVYVLDPKPNGAQPVRILEQELGQFESVGPIIWHPDKQRQRISFSGVKVPQVIEFWTQPLTGGAAVPAKVSDELLGELKGQLERRNYKWAPDGDALYFEGTIQGVRNIWKVGVDPITLRWVSRPERLTTNPGIDVDLSIAPKGDKLAYVAQSETSRLWSLPFDARARRLTGGSETPLTPANISVSGFDLWLEGRTLPYIATRPGKTGMELWSGSLDGGQPVLLREAFLFIAPRVSRDGTRVAFRIIPERDQAPRIAWRTFGVDQEQTLPHGLTLPWDWSPKGDLILHRCATRPSVSLCTSPATATTTADEQQILSDPESELWQGRYSPDGRWIVFNAQTRNQGGASVLGVVSSAGGKWTQITDPNFWADKPRWAPDGKTIYYISDRDSAFFDVWGVKFDPTTGAGVGQEFRVTRYDNPGRMIPGSGGSDLGVTQTRLVVPIRETSGNVYVLDGIKR